MDNNFGVYQPSNVPALPQNQPNQPNYVPKNQFTYEKMEKEQILKEDKIEYDPFGDIDDLNLQVKN